MTQLVVDMPPEMYEWVNKQAKVLGKSSSAVVVDMLAMSAKELPSLPPVDMRARAIQALRDAGLLVEISQQEKELAKQWTMPLEEIRAALGEAGGQPLSELIIEMRGPKG